MKNNTWLIVVILFFVTAHYLLPLVEGAATAPGVFDQLASTSPYYTDEWMMLRPVRQRGMYFYDPSWTR